MILFGEKVVSSAVEKIGDAMIQKMNLAEEKRNREFAHQLKELEFYKANYDKDIKSIFDGWFDILHNILIASNMNVDEKSRKEHQKLLDKLLKTENAISLKIRTMKYCGTETGKALALYSQMTFDSNKDVDIPQFALIYVNCILLSVMKKEVLGQVIEPINILKILLTDYEEKETVIYEGISYVKSRQEDLGLDFDILRTT